MSRSKLKRGRFSPLILILGILLFAYAILLFFPLLWGLMTSLKSNPEFVASAVAFPKVLHFDNYAKAFSYFYVPIQVAEGTGYVTLVTLFENSFLYAIGSALLASFVPCVVAYLVVRYNYAFSKVLYLFVLIAMALPIVGSLPSEIQMAKTLGLYDQIFGIWIMKSHFLGMYFLVYYAAFKGFSGAYEEAAEIDGANQFLIFFRIMFPLVKNVFFTIFLIKFIEFWNDYNTPLIFMPSYPTVAYGMYYYNNEQHDNLVTFEPLKIAGCMLMLLPILLLFSIFSNKLMANLTIGGVKE